MALLSLHVIQAKVSMNFVKDQTYCTIFCLQSPSFFYFSGKQKVALPSLYVIFVEQNNISIIEVDVAAEVYTIVSRTKGKKTQFISRGEKTLEIVT